MFSSFFLVFPSLSVRQRVEEAQQERRELLKAMRLLQEEKQQLQEEQKRLAREREQERETCCLLRTHNQVGESEVLGESGVKNESIHGDTGSHSWNLSRRDVSANSEQWGICTSFGIYQNISCSELFLAANKIYPGFWTCVTCDMLRLSVSDVNTYMHC